MAVGGVWDRARKNCLSYKAQFQEKDTSERAYAKLDLDGIFVLLSDASRSAMAGVVEIRQLMLRRHWHVTATLHKGGYGNKSGKDQELHFNVLFPGEAFKEKKRHFHIRCKAKPDESVVVFQVTDGSDA